MKIIKVVCDWCDSDDVKADAWAEWDADRQVWKLSDVGDYFYCGRCCEEVSVKQITTEGSA